MRHGIERCVALGFLIDLCRHGVLDNRDEFLTVTTRHYASVRTLAIIKLFIDCDYY